MRTLIRGGWAIGYDGATHTLIRDGVVVYESDRIVYVGRDFAGTADVAIEAPGMLIAPGFIDVHTHSGDRAGHRLISDGGRPEYFGTPLLDAGLRRQSSGHSPP